MVVEDLETLCPTLEMDKILGYYLSETDKRYVYSLEIRREGSALSKIKNLLRKLLITTSEFNNLSGSKVRRTTNQYQYTILIDCSEGRFPTTGVVRLARLLHALNERQYLAKI